MGQGTQPKRHPCRMAGGTRPCVPPCLMKEGLKPSLATTHAKVSRRVIATHWAGKTRGGICGKRPMKMDGWSGVTEAKDGERGPCVPPCFKKVNLKPSLAKTHAEVSRRVIVTLALGVQVAKKLL
jgi:hypothetical protein